MGDSTAIANLIARYAELVDAGDFEGIADLLADAGIADGDDGTLLRGRDALAAIFTATTRRYEDGTPRTKHVTTNLLLDIDPEAGVAAARSYWTVLQATEGLPLQPILAGYAEFAPLNTHGQNQGVTGYLRSVIETNIAIGPVNAKRTGFLRGNDFDAKAAGLIDRAAGKN